LALELARRTSELERAHVLSMSEGLPAADSSAPATLLSSKQRRSHVDHQGDHHPLLCQCRQTRVAPPCASEAECLLYLGKLMHMMDAGRRR